MDGKVAFIGTGNMGTAMIKNLAKSGTIEPSKIFVFDIDREKLSVLAGETGANMSDTSIEAVENADVIILAVKPNILKPVLNEIKYKLTDNKIIVSVAVGVPIKFYKSIIGENKKVIRTMPNTPAMVGEGMTLISCGENITDKELDLVKGLFECLGKVEILDEKLMSEVTALTGSSPAYVFMFIEAMADAAVQSGIPRALSYRLASQAVLGSAKMVLETGKHPAELKDQVCSPAGTTIEAVAALEKNGFRNAVIEAMSECTRRAREIGKQFE